MTKTKKRVLIGAAVAVGLVVAYVVEERLRGTWALRAWQTKMRAAGERLTTAEVALPLPTNAAVRNLSPNQASAELSAAVAPKDAPSALAVVTPGKVRCVSRLDSWKDGDGQTISWAGLATDIKAAREALPRLRAELTNRAFFVKLDYEEGFDLLLPQMARYKGIAQALSVVALFALHEGDLAEATENLVTFPALVEACQRERLLIGDLVANAVGNIGAGAAWDALQHDGWTDAQLAAIQRGWQSATYLASMSRALEMERAVGAIYFDRSRYPARAILKMLGGTPVMSGWRSSSGDNPWWAEWLQPVADLGAAARFWVEIGLWSVAWREQDQLRHHQIVQAWVEEARTAATNRHFTTARADDRDRYILPLETEAPDRPGAMRYWLTSVLTPALERAISKAAAGDAFNELTVTACALKRSRLRHGQWPATLAALVPEFLADVPRDWYTGEPLRYSRRDDGGFLLYSVGPDRKDDGGDARPAQETATPSVVRGRDLVWPAAATAEEVAATPVRRYPLAAPAKTP